MKALHKAALIGVTLALYSTAASAQLTNQGMLDQVVTEFATRATSWQTVVMNAAMFLFWTLGTISLVFTFGFMALRKADIGEFFAEFIRFILFFGFFLWLLRYGPTFANSIIQSLARLGEQASGVASVTPSDIVDIGFMILKQAFRNSSIWSPVDSFIGVALSVGILILLAVVAVNMLLLLVSASVFSYYMSWERLPQEITEMLMNVSSNPHVMLMLVNILLLIMGMFLEGGAVLIITAPLLVPVMIQMGVDPIHFGMVMIVNIMIGGVTPPFGSMMFTTCSITKIPIAEFVRESIPFIIALIVALLIVTYWPWLIMLLPNLI